MQFDLKSFWGKFWPAVIAAFLAALGLPAATQFQGCKGVPTQPTVPAPPPEPPPPKPPAPPDPQPTPDPVKAIGRLVMQNGYCSATVVGPPPSKGPPLIVSAAHCVARVGESVTFLPRGLAQVRCSVVAIDRMADVSILMPDQPVDLPWVRVAQATPPVGSRVMHAGFGQDQPGNLEQGVILQGPNSQSQVRFRLSVSPGDSGGGICLTDAGELVSPVCCTDNLAQVGNVWGGSPERINQMLRQPAAFIDLPPMRMPSPPTRD